MDIQDEEREATGAETDRLDLPGKEQGSDPMPGQPGDGRRDGIEHDRREEAADPAEWGQTK